MRIIAFLSSLAIASACFAATPTTQPISQPQVMVFPFNSVGQQQQPWIAKAIEANFIAELARGGELRPVESPVNETQTSDIVDEARDHGAQYVLVGSYQQVDGELRATGQIIDTANGEVLGGLTATGQLHDLFTIEDTLAMQAKRVLNPAPPPSEVASAKPVQPIKPSGPLVESTPTVTNEFQPAVYQPAPQTYVPQYTQYYFYSVPYSYPVYYYFPSRSDCGRGWHGGHGGWHGGGTHGHISWGGAGVVADHGW